MAIFSPIAVHRQLFAWQKVGEVETGFSVFVSNFLSILLEAG
jgi:hypothetical protein